MYERWELQDGVAHVYVEHRWRPWKPWLLAVHVWLAGAVQPVILHKQFWTKAAAEQHVRASVDELAQVAWNAS